ncbi:DNA polymerase III subunit delta' [Lujinxingia sediminis]|uniref:DNA polymerase III subunit delta' n=1 Tax=Lujinxingia sediminis TaxID=2480984 RepID=UPI0032217744
MQAPTPRSPSVRKWSELLGNSRTRQVLTQAMSSGRMHHAYLFSGPTGVGKYTTALSFAASLNCLEHAGDVLEDACMRCTACKRIEASQHPDVLEIAPSGNFIKIDQIRAIQKAALSPPYEARYRAVLIDQAHAMTEEGANALLKTLEEPSARTLLFLITDQPHRLLDTIISRCQRLRFGALSDDEVARALPDVLEEPADEALLKVAAGYGEGSLGRAVEVLDSGMLEQREELLEAFLAVPADRANQWLETAERFGRGNSDLEAQLDVLIVYFRDLMLARRADRQRVINADLMALIDKGVERFSLDAILRILDTLTEARGRLKRNVNAQLIVEGVLDQIRQPS